MSDMVLLTHSGLLAKRKRFICIFSVFRLGINWTPYNKLGKNYFELYRESYLYQYYVEFICVMLCFSGAGVTQHVHVSWPGRGLCCTFSGRIQYV